MSPIKYQIEEHVKCRKLNSFKTFQESQVTSGFQMPTFSSIFAFGNASVTGLGGVSFTVVS